MTDTSLTIVVDTTSVSDIRPDDLRPWGMSKYTGGQASPTHDEIAQIAYILYESRGCQDGHALEDWLRAEQHLACHK